MTRSDRERPVAPPPLRDPPEWRGRRQSVPIGAGDQHLQGQRRVGERGLLAEPTPPAAPAPPNGTPPVASGGPPVVGPAVRLGLISPVRVVDTRGGIGGKRLAANRIATYNVVGRGGVQSSTSAVLINIWASSPAAGGSLVAFSCHGPAPVASSVAYWRGQLVGNLVHVGVVNGKVCVMSSAATDVIIDVVAADGSQGAGVTAIDAHSPLRLAYRRATAGRWRGAGHQGLQRGRYARRERRQRHAHCRQRGEPGTLKVWPCDRPAPGLPMLVVTQGASGLRVLDGLVRVAADGTVCVSSSVATDIVMDATSAWAVGGASTLRAITPASVSTYWRNAGGKVSGGSVLSVNVAGPRRRERQRIGCPRQYHGHLLGRDGAP